MKEFDKMMPAFTLIALSFAMMSISLDSLTLAGITFIPITSLALGIITTILTIIVLIFGIVMLVRNK